MKIELEIFWDDLTREEQMALISKVEKETGSEDVSLGGIWGMMPMATVMITEEDLDQ